MIRSLAAGLSRHRPAPLNSVDSPPVRAVTATQPPGVDDRHRDRIRCAGAKLLPAIAYADAAGAPYEGSRCTWGLSEPSRPALTLTAAVRCGLDGPVWPVRQPGMPAKLTRAVSVVG